MNTLNPSLRNLMRDDTLILFGRSPFINEIRDKIPYLIENYHTMGCNTFCESFPDVEYVIFYDDISPKVKDSIIITDEKNLTRNAKELLETHRHETYQIKKDDWTFSEDKNVLHLCVHTPSMALNWAYQKGFKEVILAGIDLIPDTPHFDSCAKIFSNEAIKQARKHLEQIATKYLNIYQLNPNSYLDLPKKELI